MLKATIKRTENPNNYPGNDEFVFHAKDERELKEHMDLLHARYPEGSVRFEVVTIEHQSLGEGLFPNI